MTSIVCPKCKSHITVWDSSCLNCGLTITEEIREQLSKEQQSQRLKDNLRDIPAQVKALKPDRKYKFQKTLNKYSFGLFKTGFTEIVVPVLFVLLIIAVIALMIIQ